MTEAPFEELYHEEVYVLPSRTLVVIDKPWIRLSEDEKILLNKILGSVKLSLAQVQVIEREDLAMDDIKSLDPQRVICFGASLKSVGTPYQSVLLDGIPVITAVSLNALDDTKKKNLWLGLRQMFGI